MLLVMKFTMSPPPPPTPFQSGFGSLIRAIGMQINKSNNKQACRDLSGRRVRDVNAEKK